MKKIKVFSDFQLEPVKNDVVPITISTFQNARYNRINYDMEPDIEKLAEIMGNDYLIRSDNFSEELLDDFRNNENSLLRKSRLTGIDNRGDKDRHGKPIIYIDTKIVNNVDVSEKLSKSAPGFVGLFPNLPRNTTLEDKVDYASRFSYKEGTLSYNIKNYNILSLIDIDKNGDLLEDSAKKSLIRYSGASFHRFNLKDFHIIQLYIAWVVIFNELTLVDDDDKALKDWLKDKNFTNNITNSFNNFLLRYSPYTSTVLSLFYSSKYTSGITNAKTLKSRDEFLVLRKKDFIELENINKNKADKKYYTFYRHTNEQKPDELARKFIQAVQGIKTTENITIDNVKNIIMSAELRGKTSFLTSIAENDGTFKINDSLNKEYTTALSEVSPSSILNDYTVKIQLSILAKVLNIFGEEYILKNIKLSHLDVLCYTILYPKSMIGNMNSGHMCDFIESLLKDDNTNENKNAVLEFFYHLFSKERIDKIDLNKLKKGLITIHHLKTIPPSMLINSLGLETNTRTKSSPTETYYNKGH